MDTESIYDNPARLFEAMTGGNVNIPRPEFVTLSHVKRTAEHYAKEIFSCQQVLIHILERYEATLIKRWSKKSLAQRRKVLLHAFPSIPSTHRPDFDAMRKESPGKPPFQFQVQLRDSWLLPSLNLEDLVKPKMLPLFLRSRTLNPPGDFVNADFNSIHLRFANTSSELPRIQPILGFK